MTPRILMTLMALAACCDAAEPSAVGRAEALFKEAHELALKNRKKITPEALAKIEAGIKELDAASAAGDKLTWRAYNDVKWAAQRTREDLLDYDKSLLFCRKLMSYGNRGRWELDGRLQMALTYRAMRKFGKAQQQYDAIVKNNPKDRKDVLLPVAVMVYLEMGDRQRGRKLLNDALMNKDVSGLDRYRVAIDCARQALYQGRRDEAMEWYGMVERLAGTRPRDRLRYLPMAWFEMGRIEESRGRTDAAKALYRKARDLKGGNVAYRVRARNGIESIEYFE